MVTACSPLSSPPGLKRDAQGYVSLTGFALSGLTSSLLINRNSVTSTNCDFFVSASETEPLRRRGVELYEGKYPSGNYRTSDKWAP